MNKENKIKEELSSVIHNIWASWMKHVFSQCVVDDWTLPKTSGYEGRWIIPHDQVVKWHRQINTPYNELSEREKDSDREQADKILKMFLNDLTNNN